MRIKGIIPAVITPTHDQELDFEATTKHVNILIEEGVDGLFILGTNGEFHVLSDDEKIAFAKHVIAVTDKRVAVYVGVGACGTKQTIDFAKRVAALKPDALSVITPYLVKVSQAELIAHYRALADAVDVPIILYNIPANTGNTIEASTLDALIDHPNIIGIKDSSGNLELLKAYFDVRGDREFDILVGSDSKILDATMMGASGCVASTANAITPHIRQLLNAYEARDLETARRLQNEIDVIRNVMKHGTVPSLLKRIVSLKNGPVGEARFPTLPVGDQYDGEILEMLAFYAK